MALESMPLLLFGLLTGISPTLIPECGSLVDPSTFSVYDDFGTPQPKTASFLQVSASPLILKVLRTSGTWTNTGKPVRADLTKPFTVTGSISCTVPLGNFRIWVGSLSFSYAEFPETLEYVSGYQAMAGDFSFDFIPDDYFLTLGIDFEDLQLGSQVTLQKLLITNDETIDICQSRVFDPYVEPPLRTRSFAPNNKCIFKDSQVDSLQDEVGTCSCDVKSGFGGPTCEYPTTLGAVCSGFGDDGGSEITPGGTRVRLIDTSGVYLLDNKFLCKCMNPGLLIDTILRPASVFDFQFTKRNDKLPNVPDFIAVSEIPADIAFPATFDSAIDICSSVSGTLPSWKSSAEARAIITLVEDEVFFSDLKAAVEDLRWVERNEPFFNLGQNVTTFPDVYCDGTDLDLCDALNWNNLAYNLTGTGVTDGKKDVVSKSADVLINFPVSLGDVTVEVYTGELAPGLSVKVDGRSCTRKSLVDSGGVFTCVFLEISLLRVSKTSYVNPLLLREVAVYGIKDPGRVPLMFV